MVTPHRPYSECKACGALVPWGRMKKHLPVCSPDEDLMYQRRKRERLRKRGEFWKLRSK